MNNLRLLYIDYVKGIVVLLLLFSHASPSEGVLKTWIFAFHMPIFFIVCGILIQLKYSNKETFNATVYLKKRYNNIFKPYLFFGLLLCIFYCCINVLSGEAVGYSHLIRLLTLQGIDSLWFLPVYFFAEFLFLLFSNKIKINGMIILVILAILCVGGEVVSSSFGQVKRVLVGYVFIYVGYICAKFKIINEINMKLGIILLLVFSLSACLNDFSSMFNINNPFLFFVNAIGISIAIMAISHNFEKQFAEFAERKSLLYFWGVNSIIVLCTNNILIETIRLLDYQLTGNILLSKGLFGDFIFFVILTLLEIPVIRLFEGKFGR